MNFKNSKTKSPRLNLTRLSPKAPGPVLQSWIIYSITTAWAMRLGQVHLTGQRNKWVVLEPKRGTNMRGKELWGLLCPMPMQATAGMLPVWQWSCRFLWAAHRHVQHKIPLPPPGTGVCHTLLVLDPGPENHFWPSVGIIVKPAPWPAFLPQMQYLDRQMRGWGEQRPDKRICQLCLVSRDEVNQGSGVLPSLPLSPST